MSSTAISNSRCSTLIMTNAASRRSTSMTRRRSGPWRSYCGPVSRRAASRCVPIFDAWVRHIRTRWHKTRITFRGDGHYARPEAMTWCENSGIDYIFGLSGTKPLARKVDEVADDIRTRRAIENPAVLRGYAETRHQAKSWHRKRRTAARIGATMLSLDIRFVVTSLDVGLAEWIYERMKRLRGFSEVSAPGSLNQPLSIPFVPIRWVLWSLRPGPRFEPPGLKKQK